MKFLWTVFLLYLFIEKRKLRIKNKVEVEDLLN